MQEHVVADAEADADAAALTSALLTASRLLVAISARSLAATAEERVTLPQFRMLVLLAGHGETNLVTLADSLAVNPSTALRMVDRLVDGGFVTRRVNPASRREVLLRLTPTGRQIVTEVRARRREEIAAIVARMPPRDRAGLVSAFQAFAAAGGEEQLEERERDMLPLGWD
jgi:DNA-binding MarR family transcriptional regulator